MGVFHGVDKPVGFYDLPVVLRAGSASNTLRSSSVLGLNNVQGDKLPATAHSCELRASVSAQGNPVLGHAHPTLPLRLSSGRTRVKCQTVLNISCVLRRVCTSRGNAGLLVRALCVRPIKNVACRLASTRSPQWLTATRCAAPLHRPLPPGVQHMSLGQSATSWAAADTLQAAGGHGELRRLKPHRRSAAGAGPGRAPAAGSRTPAAQARRPPSPPAAAAPHAT